PRRLDQFAVVGLTKDVLRLVCPAIAVVVTVLALQPADPLLCAAGVDQGRSTLFLGERVLGIPGPTRPQTDNRDTAPHQCQLRHVPFPPPKVQRAIETTTISGGRIGAPCRSSASAMRTWAATRSGTSLGERTFQSASSRHGSLR